MTAGTAWLLLATVPGVGPTTFWRLVGRFGSAEAVLGASELELVGMGRCSPDVASAITRVGAREGAVLDRIEKLRASGVRVALAPGAAERGEAPADIAYPALLAARRAPPPVLFVSGEIAEGDARAVAVVGSRRASEEGLRAAGAISGQLARAGATVVSGLALGVDTTAHESALESGGRTIAVLGSGIDRVYPPANLHLAERIAAQGAVVSEFAPSVPVSREGLLARNRTIAGLSRAVIVVQTRDPGGAVVAAQHADEFGVATIAVTHESWGDEFARGAEAVRALGGSAVDAAAAADEALALLEREPEPAQPSLL
jgi:DNA processing protein